MGKGNPIKSGYGYGGLIMSHVKETYYFSHDSNARRDPKILALRSVYGAEGYGWYWMIVEMLREQQGFRLDISSKYAYKAIAMEMGCDEEKAEQFIRDCIEEFHLFKTDGKCFWSNSLLRRMEVSKAKAEQARKAAHARWAKRNAPAMREHSTSNANQCISNASKVNKNKVNKNKVKESKVKESTGTPPIVPPLDEQCERITTDDNDGDNGNSALKKIYDAFSENIHPITPFEAETLGAWVDDGMEPDAIIWAIRQAVLQGKRTAKYIDAIIRNLHTENITTAAGAEARERNRADGKRREPGKAREPTRLSPQEKERIAELNRQLANS